MIDPVTIGVLAASTLAFGADAVSRNGIPEVVKDAYRALKEKVATWVRDDVEALEKEPTSTTRQAVIAEEIDKQSPDDRADIKKLAVALNEALQNIPADQLGIDITKLNATRFELNTISVEEGVGFRADEIKTSGDIILGDITLINSYRLNIADLSLIGFSGDSEILRDNAEYVVWYATNRQPKVKHGAIVGFSSGRDREMHYGQCRVFVPKAHKIGSTGSNWWKRLFALADDRLKLLGVDAFGIYGATKPI
jgi:hypothetical protein